jgi:hypothetical protein
VIKRSIDDLPKFSPWPALLLGKDGVNQRTKNQSEVEREYQDEKWSGLLTRIEESPWPLRLADLDYMMQGGDDPAMFSSGSDLFETTARDAHLRYREFVAETLKPLLPASALVELGAGYGSVIVDLARRPEFMGNRMIGLDLTPAGAELIRLMSQAEGVQVESGLCNLLDDQVTDADIPAGALIYTSYAAHYEPRHRRTLVSALAGLNPKAVVFIEPCYEHCDDSTLLGLLRRRYIEVNDYNTNLVTLLRERSDAGEVKILDERKAAFGPNPLLAASVIVWEPAERS